MIYLDITRIFNRVTEQSPTGIDRVELEYAKHGLNSGYFFAYQRGNELFGAPRYLTETVVTYLRERWELGHSENPNIEKSIAAWKKTLKGNTPKPNPAVAFLKKIKDKPLKERIRLLSDEKKYIKKVTPNIPTFLAANFVACFPSLIIKHYQKKPATKPAGIHWLRIFDKCWYLNVGHTGLEKKDLFALLKNDAGVKIALYLHDLLPMTHPHLFVTGTEKTHKVRMDNMARFSDLIIANSYYTKSKFEESYKHSKIHSVLEIGSQEEPQRKQICPNTKPREGFVSIGTIEPRKNYLWLAQAWDEFCQTHPDIVKDEKLTIFGKIGWLHKADLEKLQKLTRRGKVEIISGASDSVVQEALSTARAYVTAAEVEGWGMPLAESLSIGTPVIATDVAAHREVTRSIAKLFPFNDSILFHTHLKDCYDPIKYEMIVTEASTYAPWNWNSHFDRLDKLFNTFTGAAPLLTAQSLAQNHEKSKQTTPS